MPSPFPGMDPYIEAPEVWSDFHGRLAEEISASLNEVLQPQYIARLTPRVSYEIVEIAESRNIRPAVGVWQSQFPSSGPGGGAAPVATAPVESAVAIELPLRLYTIEVCETKSTRLVTAIEILSPVNKRRSHDAHHDYLRKRRELLRSDAHLVEIDLLRGGDRPPLERPVPAAPYYVTVSRASRRPNVDVWPIQLWQPLPTLPVPLREPDPDVPLNLSAVLASVYQRGAYARLIDYQQTPPPPPLADAEAAWLDRRLQGGER